MSITNLRRNKLCKDEKRRGAKCRSTVFFNYVASALFFSIALCVGAPNGSAQNIPHNAPLKKQTAETECPPLNTLDAFFDGAVGTLMTVHDIPGGVISVTCGADLIFSKGYGFVDAARTRPADPARTLFRPGSVSKTVTWTAVMQLVEAGKLDLDADVNTYLTQFKIPKQFSKPVTMRSIMSHSAGFEDVGTGYLFRRSPDELLSLAKALEETMPTRVRPVGEVSSYSNWGTALAGLIVANISGVEFDAYVEQNIFKPLGMKQSTFREPVPAPLDMELSENLTREGGDFRDGGFEFIHDFGPAGSLSSTAEDMARFMIAHLTNGGGILAPATIRKMRTPLFGQHHSLPAMLYGFFEERHNGHITYGHGGDTVYFHTTMTMAPDVQVGVFISFNSPDGAYAARQIIPAFFDRYYPLAKTNPNQSLTNKNGEKHEGLKKYSGSYRTTRRSYSNWEKAFNLGSDTNVALSPDGGLVISSFFLKDSLRFIPVGENLFRSVDDPDELLAFRTDESDAVEYMFISPTPFSSYQRIGWVEQSATHQVLIGFSLFIFAGVVAGGVWGAPKWFAMKSGEKVARALVFTASLTNLLFVASGFLIVSSVGTELIFSGIPGLGTLLTMPVIACALAFTAVIFTLIAWKDGYWSIFARLRYSCVVIFLLLFAFSMNYWNLLGPWYG